MKIREGFVSNSSSSSFIMRGAIFTQSELIDALGIREEIETYLEGGDDEDEFEVYEAIANGLPDGLSIEATGNYFGRSDYNNLLVGENFGELEDGEVVEIEDYTNDKDQEILDKLAGIGLQPPTKLKTYIQMVSNDNY